MKRFGQPTRRAAFAVDHDFAEVTGRPLVEPEVGGAAVAVLVVSVNEKAPGELLQVPALASGHKPYRYALVEHVPAAGMNPSLPLAFQVAGRGEGAAVLAYTSLAGCWLQS